MEKAGETLWWKYFGDFSHWEGQSEIDSAVVETHSCSVNPLVQIHHLPAQPIISQRKMWMNSFSSLTVHHFRAESLFCSQAHKDDY